MIRLHKLLKKKWQNLYYNCVESFEMPTVDSLFKLVLNSTSQLVCFKWLEYEIANAEFYHSFI